jgi:hypothetical protein
MTGPIKIDRNTGVRELYRAYRGFDNKTLFLTDGNKIVELAIYLVAARDTDEEISISHIAKANGLGYPYNVRMISNIAEING